MSRDEPSSDDHGVFLDGTEGAAPAGAGAAALPAVPPFHRRFVQVFVDPGKLMRALAARPVWGAALATAVLLIVLQTALIPWEVVEASQREAALRAGRTPPEVPENVARLLRFATPILAGLAATLFTFLFAGVYAVIFAFLLGDEGRYTQYLAVTCHSTLIPAVVALALVPLKISQENPQLTLNLGAFFFFLPEGYPLRVLTMMDLSQVWAALVVALGAHAIDARRGFASAAAILMVFVVVIAMIFALFMPSV